MKKIIKWLGISLVILLLFVAVTQGPWFYRIAVGFNRHETAPATLPTDLTENAILIFSKTNGFYRHDDAIAAANQALIALAKQNNWSTFSTEDAGVFNPEQLKRFKTTVWNNASGDVLTTEQRAAFKNYITNGGGFVGIHAAGGDPKYAWPWYVETLIGAQFIGHPMFPQFQPATLHIDTTDPITHALGATWSRTDEWYSFATSPRKAGVHILATLDEKTYSPKMFGTDLHMGADHPMIWKHCVEKGRVFYSALGHTAESYAEPKYLSVLEHAIAWSAGFEGTPCP